MKPIVHASDHRRGGPDPLPPRAILHIKLFPDLATEEAMGIDTPVTTGTDVFVFLVTKDMDGLCLIRAEGFLSTVGSGDTAVTLRNKTTAIELLVEPINIESMEESTATSSTFPEPLATADAIVYAGNLIGIDVTDAAADSHGLGVILEFAPPSLPPLLPP